MVKDLSVVPSNGIEFTTKSKKTVPIMSEREFSVSVETANNIILAEVETDSGAFSLK